MVLKVRLFLFLQENSLKVPFLQSFKKCNTQEQGGIQDEQAQIQELLRKKHFDPGQADYKELQKIFAYLSRKGFSIEQIRKAVQTGDYF